MKNLKFCYYGETSNFNFLPLQVIMSPSSPDSDDPGLQLTIKELLKLGADGHSP